MKKILFLPLLLGLLSSYINAMMHSSKISTTSHKPLPFKFSSKQLFSTQNRFKPLTALSLPEVEQLANSKELARKHLKNALLFNEDCECNTTISSQSQDIKNLWKKVFHQFSIQEWNSMFLEREEDSILETINPDLLNFIKKINFEKLAKYNVKTNKNFASIAHTIHNSILRNHILSKEFYEAKPLEESLQKYYQQSLQDIGYPKMKGLIFRWNNNLYGHACSMHPHTYIKSTFFNLPLEECLGILAHENEHTKNLHMHKRITIRSFLGTQEIPDLYARFIEKEADLKASAYSLEIAIGLLCYFTRLKESAEKLTSCSDKIYQTTYPSYNERIHYIKDLFDKLEKEKKGYAWNPFYKIIGPYEWFIDTQKEWINSKLNVKTKDFWGNY